MSRTTCLYIQVNNQWNEIDLFDNVTIPLTFKVTDIREFGSKTSGYSLDFDIPNTANNAQVFGLNSEIDVYESTFEVGRDYPAYLTDEGLTTFNGQFRLRKVIKKNRGSYIYYIGYLYGGSKNLVDNLGNQTLVGNDDPSNDLSFSEYKATASEMTLQDFYYYLQSLFTDGRGWGLTLIDKTNKASQSFTNGYQLWYCDETTPYLYWNEIFTKIINSGGYRIASEFLQGTNFSSYLADPRWADTIGKYNVDSLVYPFMKNNNAFDFNEVTSNVLQLSSSSSCVVGRGETFYTTSIERWSLVKHTMEFDTTQYILQQTNANASFPSYKFVASTYGNYKINFKFPIEARLLMRKTNDDIITSIPNNTILTGHPVTPAPDRSFVFYVGLEKNGTIITSTRQIINQDLEAQYTTSGGGITFELSDFTGNTECFLSLAEINFDVSLSNIYLNVGDTISFYCWIEVPTKFTRVNGSQSWQESIFYNVDSQQNTTQYYPKYIEAKLNPSSVTNIIEFYSAPSFKEEADFDPTAILNPKTKKLDVVSNFIKAFNLYVEDVSGKTNYKDGTIYAPNTLRIEPYEIFYQPELGNGQSNMKEWTSKVDWESVEYRRFDDYLYNIQSFTKVQDGDFYNANYNKTYKLPYGNRNISGVYCTQDERNEINLAVSSNICGVVNAQTDTLQCPKVFTLDNSGNIDTKKEYTDGMFFLWKNEMNLNSDIGQNYTLRLQSRVHSNQHNDMTWYYCADTLNRGYGADEGNLNWGQTSVWYQNLKGTQPTFNDLYEAFYKKEYEEKTAPDARILKCRCYLTAWDIYNMQLSDLIIINGNTYHIAEINQWKNEHEPVECEFIKCIPTQTETTPQKKFIYDEKPAKLPISVDNSTILQQIEELQKQVKELQTK